MAELWETVAKDLTVDWKLEALAAACSVSAEHLRRLCRSELGRTPMEHVTFLRVQRAQDLLATTTDKLDAIAPQVGYRSAEVFSRAFVRCTGMTPTEYVTHARRLRAWLQETAPPARIIPYRGNRLVLYLRDQRMISVNLEKSCRARDFYSGFYVEKSKDGRLCVDRDKLQSRTGARCEVEAMRQLVEVKD